MHSFVSHGDPVGDGDRDELKGDSPAVADRDLRPLGQSIKGHIAGGYLVPARGDADLGLGHVLVGQAHRPQHGPSRRAAITDRDF